MLEGGQNPEGTFLPLTDIVLKKEIESAAKVIKQFKLITIQRFESIGANISNTDIDQQHDQQFRTSINKINIIKTLLQQKIRSDYNRYRLLQVLLILMIIISVGLFFLVQHRYKVELKNNISAIKEARDIAEKNENWLKTTLNSMGDGVIIADRNGHVTYLNPVASALTGWDLNKAPNKPIADIFHIVNEQTNDPIGDSLKKVISKKTAIKLDGNIELISKNGHRWPVSDSIAPIFDHDNNLLGIVLIFRETTAQRDAEKEKSNLEAQLRQVFKMEVIGTMAGGIAHDFNNILAIILGNADMAIDDIPEGNRAKFNIEQIVKAGSRAKELVKQILSFSRKDAGNKKPSYLCQLIEENMKSLRSTIPTSVNLTISIPEACKNEISKCSMVLVDPTQIHQLLLNLCVNAVQAMDEKGQLKVEIKEVDFSGKVPKHFHDLSPGKYEHIEVSDTGPGIKPEIIERIFDPFFTTKGDGKGTGMGLAVVHGIVENHEGRIFVESTPTQGTTFHIYIPITESRDEEIFIKNLYLPRGNERILFIDDEEMLAEIGKRLIERQGYSVTSTTDSVEALKLFKNNPSLFDLVITDQTMPNLTGAELAEEMLQLQPDLPVILCTGYSSRIDKIHARQKGIKEFVSKPLNRRETAQLIRKVLDENIASKQQRKNISIKSSSQVSPSGTPNLY